MIEKIIGTTFSRGLIAIFGLLILILNTRFLGAEKIGELAIVIVLITFAVRVSEFIGGPSLVYLQRKYSTQSLLFISYLWALFISTIVLGSLAVFNSLIQVSTILVSSIVLLQSFNHCNLHLLIGKEKIATYNVSNLVHTVTLLVGVTVLYFYINETQVSSYLEVFLYGQILQFIITIVVIIPTLGNDNLPKSSSRMYREILSYGGIIQITNILQFGVYRINYIILETIAISSNLGVFVVGNQISEKALIPGSAISLVQYSKIANSNDKNEAISITVSLINASAIISFITLIVLVLIPEELISWTFGIEFTAIKKLFLYLVPGIFFLSISTIYSHYFAGLAEYKFNLFSSGIGLIISIAFSLALIPKYGIIGAATATSLVFFCQTVLQAYFFKKFTKIRWSVLLKMHQDSLLQIPSTLFKMLKTLTK